jgi:hypothetical protein
MVFQGFACAHVDEAQATTVYGAAQGMRASTMRSLAPKANAIAA